MRTINNEYLVHELSDADLKHVTGGKIKPIELEPIMAEDMYGNKIDPQEWMDQKLRDLGIHVTPL